MTMVSKKMSTRLLMKSTKKHMNGTCNVTRDVSPLKIVLIYMFSKKFVTYNRRSFTSISVGAQLSVTAAYYKISLKFNQ